MGSHCIHAKGHNSVGLTAPGGVGMEWVITVVCPSVMINVQRK